MQHLPVATMTRERIIAVQIHELERRQAMERARPAHAPRDARDRHGSRDGADPAAAARPRPH